MAKQAGDLFIEGTLDDLTFYKMNGTYYVRMKTSLTAKRFWKDKAFEGSRRSCNRFAKGNQLASAVFRLVLKEKRIPSLFPFLRTRAIALLKEGKPAEEVTGLLLDYLVDFGFIEAERTREQSSHAPVASKGRGEKNSSISFRVNKSKEELECLNSETVSSCKLLTALSFYLCFRTLTTTWGCKHQDSISFFFMFFGRLRTAWKLLIAFVFLFMFLEH
jgi:hypothetical protein